MTITPELQELIDKRKNAVKNYNRQRKKELNCRDVRIPSSTWACVRREYDMQINTLVQLLTRGETLAKKLGI